MANDEFQIVEVGAWFEVRKNGVGLRAFMVREFAERYVRDPEHRAWCASAEVGLPETGTTFH